MTRRKIIIGIAIPVLIIIITMSFSFSHPPPDLIPINEQMPTDKETLVSSFEKELNDCSNATGYVLSNCQNVIDILRMKCSSFGNPDVCNDPRINKIDFTFANLNQTFSQPASFTTYTNSQFGFSIDYPSNWAVIGPADLSGNGNGIVAFINNKPTPTIVEFIIIKIDSNGTSFENLVGQYRSEVNDSVHPITLHSQDKVTIGNSEAYRLHFTQTFGLVVCNSESYIINDDKFVPVISFGSCYQDVYKQFLPTFDKVVSTFR